jgi:hypothetical protein
MLLEPLVECRLATCKVVELMMSRERLRPLIRHWLLEVALATAVFLDAFVIRIVLLPAVLQLLGRRTWWFHARLDRGLPRLAIEPNPTAQPAPALDEAA